MIIEKTKLLLHKGVTYVDLRTDEIERIKQKKGVTRIVVGDKYMDLPYARIRFGKKITEEVFQMQYYPFGQYQLLSYKWIPTGEVPKYKLIENKTI